MNQSNPPAPKGDGVELPKLDVTGADTCIAIDLCDADDEGNIRRLGPWERLACRERQLLAALIELQSLKSREGQEGKWIADLEEICSVVIEGAQKTSPHLMDRAKTHNDARAKLRTILKKEMIKRGCSFDTADRFAFEYVEKLLER